MIVTINTDASFNHRHKIGSYAFWIVCNHGRLSDSGPLKDLCERPEEAEFKSIINAVHALGKMKVPLITKVVINTDCLNVIHLISNDSASVKRYRLQWGEKLVKKFFKTVAAANLFGIEIDLRHVRSHVSTETPRQWVNEWCDKAAKKAIKEMIEAKVK